MGGVEEVEVIFFVAVSLQELDSVEHYEFSFEVLRGVACLDSCMRVCAIHEVLRGSLSGRREGRRSCPTSCKDTVTATSSRFLSELDSVENWPVSADLKVEKNLVSASEREMIGNSPHLGKLWGALKKLR